MSNATITTDKIIMFGLDQDVYRWLDSMSAQPSSNFVFNLNDMVSKLKAAAVWDKLDRIWLFATEDRQHAKICLKSLSAITEVASPLWTANRGYSGDGSSTYINFNYIPSSNGVNFTTLDASYGGYVRTKTDTTFRTFMGGYSPGTRDANIGTYTNAFVAAVNSSGGPTSAVNWAAGLFSAGRNGSTITLYYNGSGVTSSAAYPATSTPPTVTMYGLCRNGSGVASNFSTNELSMAYYGSTTFSHSKFYNIFQEFAIRQGFNV